jgi:hypothetical protein
MVTKGPMSEEDGRVCISYYVGPQPPLPTRGQILDQVHARADFGKVTEGGMEAGRLLNSLRAIAFLGRDSVRKKMAVQGAVPKARKNALRRLRTNLLKIAGNVERVNTDPRLGSSLLEELSEPWLLLEDQEGAVPACLDPDKRLIASLGRDPRPGKMFAECIFRLPPSVVVPPQEVLAELHSLLRIYAITLGIFLARGNVQRRLAPAFRFEKRFLARLPAAALRETGKHFYPELAHLVTAAYLADGQDKGVSPEALKDLHRRSVRSQQSDKGFRAVGAALLGNKQGHAIVKVTFKV